jgi:peptidase E
MSTSVFKPAYKNTCKGSEGNAMTFIAQAARLKIQQDYLDKEQAITIKSVKRLDHAANDIAATHKEMEYQR